MDIDLELQKKIANEVERMARILDRDVPPISFEEVVIFETPAHTGFELETLLISPSAVQNLSFDQLRTCMAYSMALMSKVKQMYRRTRIAMWAGSVTVITVFALTAMQRIPGLVSVAMAAVGIILAMGRARRSWQRKSAMDALVYRMVGDMDLVVNYIRTKGYREKIENLSNRSDIVERRIAALRGIAGR